ncbi:MAG: ABC transporter substrate-binding protein [Woeseiaceae bacterium]|nr:ABC transporter substrate-binding protein [Woeseiaceae bacterium]NIP20467.1 ABC transporter substrate-binding protein [Woeseiaceae bacterium]NIS89062.1 ABC transporter substrate-binding protein [Woeseiaceae bacterium]
MRPVWALPLLLLFLGACTESRAPSDHVSTVTRIVTLAPSLTELVYAAGAGEHLVGVSAYSDFPAAALELPVVGDAFMIDQEQLAILQPDLLLIWQGGSPAHVVDNLREMGYNVEVIRTNSLNDVSAAISRIGELTDKADSAGLAVREYEQGLAAIAARAGTQDDIRVFYQVSARPLYTISGDHYVSELISMCGGHNVFSDLQELAPTVDVEAVVERDPEVMLASTDAGDHAFTEWERWPDLAANRFGNHFRMPADAIGRATPRLVQAGEAVCAALDEARRRRLGN